MMMVFVAVIAVICTFIRATAVIDFTLMSYNGNGICVYWDKKKNTKNKIEAKISC